MKIGVLIQNTILHFEFQPSTNPCTFLEDTRKETKNSLMPSLFRIRKLVPTVRHFFPSPSPYIPKMDNPCLISPPSPGIIGIKYKFDIYLLTHTYISTIEIGNALLPAFVSILKMADSVMVSF